MKAELIKPKGPFDKLLLKRTHQRMFEALPEAVAYIRLVVRGRVKADRNRLKAVQMLLDRTIPPVQRAPHTSVNIIQANVPQVDWAEIHRRAVKTVEARERGDGSSPDPRIH